MHKYVRRLNRLKFYYLFSYIYITASTFASFTTRIHFYMCMSIISWQHKWCDTETHFYLVDLDNYDVGFIITKKKKSSIRRSNLVRKNRIPSLIHKENRIFDIAKKDSPSIGQKQIWKQFKLRTSMRSSHIAIKTLINKQKIIKEKQSCLYNFTSNFSQWNGTFNCGLRKLNVVLIYTSDM